MSEHEHARLSADAKAAANEPTAALSQTNPALSQTNPALSQTNPALSQTDPALSQTDPALSENENSERNAAVLRESARRTRRSFVAGAAATAAGYGLLHWINNSPPIGQLQSVLRRTLRADAAISRALFADRGLSPTYPLSRARPLRLNGVVGLGQELDLASWRLQMAGVAHAERSPLYVHDVTAWQYRYAGDPTQPGQPGDDLKSAPKASSIADRFDRMTQEITHKRHQGSAEAGASSSALDIGTPGLLLSMNDLMALPHVELITEFKCIEGWSEVTQWGGVRLREVLEAYPPAQILENGRSRDPRFVYMETPDGDYYCGYDMAAARHPQSLLVTHMSGKPLSQEHGAPLRLHMPIKYGYKQIKRIGLIAYTDTRPDDFWSKLGYDWYAGL
jgi:hypothetical protein